jgi:hypothetical protein
MLPTTHKHHDYISLSLAGYSPSTNFFDPDNFLALSALLYSGDEYLVDQVKRVLLRTAATMCGIGSDQDLLYCGAEANKLRHARLFSSARFNYSKLSYSR